MLHRHSEIFRSLLMVADMLLVAASWGAAYALRFHSGWFAVETSIDPSEYAWALAGIIPVAFLTLRARGLYEPQRTGSLLREVGAVVGGLSMTLLVVLAADAALRTLLSRAVFGLFFGMATISVISFRLSGRGVLRHMRRRGYNLRYLLVVGAGELARETIDSIHGHPEAGLRVIGALSNDLTLRGRTIQGVKVLGDYPAIKAALARHPVDQVVIALPREDSNHLEKILSDLDDELVTVRLIPDLLHVMTLRSSVEDLDGLPVINLRESPLIGWAGIQKRSFDLAVTGAAMLVAAPLMAAIALVIRLTSGRPVLYAQERMGLDGRVFHMLKFRTMRSDAEETSGPVWTTEDDPRRTRLGSLLRKTSLDELPQLWNVLRGDMSLVGPRPERPVFIEQFRREIPGYMLRHKVKAGMTGWAQVHGLRGRTPLADRVEYDNYYIENWSLWLDVKVLLLTVLAVFGGRSE